MTDFRDCQPYLVHLQAEHHRLQDSLDQIKQDWSEFATDPQSGDPETVLSDLNVLRSELVAHFSEEETGGCLDEAVSRNPRLGKASDRLVEEHPALIAELDQIIQQLTQDRSYPELVKLEREFIKFSERLRAHEDAERQVLASGFGINLEQ